MPTQIDIVEQKFFNQFLNGDSFSSNTSEYTTNLAGSVLEKIKFTQKIQVQWFSSASEVDEWDVESTRVIRSNGSFINDGFAIGDTFNFYNTWSGQVLDFTGTVTAISDDGLRLSFTVDSGAVTTGTDLTDVGLRGTNDLTALIYKFGLIENNEPINFISKVSGNEQAYYGVDIGKDVGSGRPTTFVDMIALGQYEDWVTGSAKVRYIQDVGNAQEFEIEHIFRINPFYVDGQLSNLKNNVIPELLSGLNSLKYAYEAEFRTAISNPNTSKSVQRESNLGSVAWFNENFNGFDNGYVLESITYKTTTGVPILSLNGIKIGTNTTVEITISRTGGVFSAGERVGGFVSLLPDDSDYTDTTTNFEYNFLLDQKYNTIGGAASSSDFIKNFQAQLSGGNVSISFEVDYSTAQQSRLTSLNNYLIAVQIGDESLSAGNSDRVMLLCDARAYVQDEDIPGLMSFTRMDLYPHELTKGTDTPFTDLIQWNEDGVLIDGEFTIDLSKDAYINELYFLVVAYNSITEEYFELDKYSFNISDAVVSGGVQQLEINDTRGYILADGDQFNQVVLSTGSKIGDDQIYTFTIGQKLSWQTWIENLDVDKAFYDKTKTNNNFNYKSSNYSNSNDYQIKFAILANVSGTSTLGRSGNTDYLFLSPDIEVYDYDTDGAAPDDFTATVETFNNSTSTNIGGSVLVGEDTLFRITWVHSSGSVASIADFYGIHRIEETGQTGYDIYELSSFRDRPDNNLLKPISGETYLKIYLSGGNIITECLIDGDLVQEGVEYNLSGKIGSPTAAGLTGGKITEDDIFKYTEDSEFKELD